MSGKHYISIAVPPLTEKMTATDSDLRTMALIDLHKELARATTVVPPSASQSTRRPTESLTYTTDDHVEKELTVNVLKLLVDPIGEVKNVAVSCLGAMVRRARPAYLRTIVDDLLVGCACTDKENEANEGRRDISCLALKAVVVEMPNDTQAATQAIDSIIKHVYPILLKPAVDPQLASELLQILADVYNRFPHVISSSSPLQTTSITSLLSILSSGRLTIRKRAIPALIALINNNPALFDQVKPHVAQGLAAGGDTAKVWSNVLASLARGMNASKVGALVGEGQVVGLVLKQVEDPEETDMVEGALVALEVLAIRCPAEMGQYVTALSEKAMELIRYDPNFVQFSDDEDDVDMDADNDDDDDDFDDEGYSDDDDVSWKVRKSAAKLLSALIATRSEYLTEFYRSVVPTLISRINEREESVRLEVLDTFESLLKQTSIARLAEQASGPRNKRKRSRGMSEESEVEESVITQLNAVLPQILRGVIKQLDGKSVSTKERCFVLLRHVTDVLDGGLDSEAAGVAASAASALRSIDSATSSSLATAALSFLASFFKHHPPRLYAQHLSGLVLAIVRCMQDKLQRISFEGFAAASALAQSLRSKESTSPLKADLKAPVQQLFDATVGVLGDASVDAEVRDRALSTLGDLLQYEGDVLVASYSKALPLISERLEHEGTAATAVNVIDRIADPATSACQGAEFDQWLISTLPAIVIALRRTRRASSKHAEVTAIATVLSRVGSLLTPQLAQGIITETQPLLGSANGLNVAALVLRSQPTIKASVDAHLPAICALVKQPGGSVALVDALVAFFAAYTAADPDNATRIAPHLVENVKQQSQEVAAVGTGVYAATARIVGAVTKESLRNAAGILALFMKAIKKEGGEADTYLALLSIGEIGRLIDLSADSSLFDRLLTFFTNKSEDVRSAAAFAAGNVAVGSTGHFLPLLLKHIDSASSETVRILLLHALKEVILHSPAAQLEMMADNLWKPLVTEDAPTTARANGRSSATTNGGAKADKKGNGALGDEGVRNVKAACIGKLTTMAPAKFLPQLQALLKSSPANRAIVAAAVRFTFIDTSSAYDELIAPIVVDFLSLMHDENYIVRRLSLASLNAAIQNKPHLVVDRLNTLQPLLYQETVVRKELQREVQMGPFKMMQDDGMENRKTAYETMYTLLATCFNKIDLPAFTERVMAALTDTNEVKVLGLMLLLRLGQLSPSSVVPKLDDAVESMKVMMKDLEVKDDTIQQDLERKAEMQRQTLRTAVPLTKISTPQQAPAFHAFVQGLLAQPAWKEFRDYQG